MRSPRLFLRMQSQQSNRAILCMVALMVAALVVWMAMPRYKTTFLAYNSWRNVSVYQLVKMHLSSRPSHVSSMSQSECSTLSDPHANGTLLNYHQVLFYDDVVEKMKNLNETQKWKTTFHPLLDRESKMSLIQLYAAFQQTLENAKLTHILMHGSAMGAWRHHGVTPWDDDIDIAIDMADWHKLRQILSCVKGYTLDSSSNSKWSFFKSNSPLIKNGSKRWPFLDLFLYTYDDDYAWGLNYVHLRKFVFPKEDIFPVQFVPFECFLVPVPRHLRKVLEIQYIHPEICTSHYTDHRNGKAKSQISVPCTELSDMYKIYNTDN